MRPRKASTARPDARKHGRIAAAMTTAIRWGTWVVSIEKTSPSPRPLALRP